MGEEWVGDGIKVNDKDWRKRKGLGRNGYVPKSETDEIWKGMND